MNVTVYPENWNARPVIIDAQPGQTLLDCLRIAGLAPEAPCGGLGKCAHCLVRAEGMLSEPGPEETAAAAKGYRLACRCRPLGDCRVCIPAKQRETIRTDGRRRTFPVTPRDGLGAAVDIGTTTVVLYLCDLTTGDILTHCSAPNAQRVFGGDVISRISYEMEHAGGLEAERDAIRNQLHALLEEACTKTGHTPDEVRRICIAANTVMLHLFAGLSPDSIAAAPYTPASLFGTREPGEQYGFPGTELLLTPCVAGYVGGDITAGLLASGASLDAGPCLFLDIGTNGEMAYISDGKIISCATAAGPAFEGAEISCGMAAKNGAVRSVDLEDGALRCDVLGGGEATGICGSGLLDLLLVLRKAGLLDETGRLLPPDGLPDDAPACRDGLSVTDSGTVFSLTDSVCITAGDIRKLQLAKAAVQAGVETLLELEQMTAGQLTGLYLAGGFGSYLRTESAAGIGLIPAAVKDRVISCGNSAGMGAVSALCSDEAWDELLHLAEQTEYVELSGNLVFREKYIDAMEFPEDF